MFYRRNEHQTYQTHKEIPQESDMTPPILDALNTTTYRKIKIEPVFWNELQRLCVNTESLHNATDLGDILVDQTPGNIPSARSINSSQLKSQVHTLDQQMNRLKRKFKCFEFIKNEPIRV